jgi:hypothetical protein
MALSLSLMLIGSSIAYSAPRGGVSRGAPGGVSVRPTRPPGGGGGFKPSFPVKPQPVGIKLPPKFPGKPPVVGIKLPPKFPTKPPVVGIKLPPKFPGKPPVIVGIKPPVKPPVIIGIKPPVIGIKLPPKFPPKPPIIIGIKIPPKYPYPPKWPKYPCPPIVVIPPWVQPPVVYYPISYPVAVPMPVSPAVEAYKLSCRLPENGNPQDLLGLDVLLTRTSADTFSVQGTVYGSDQSNQQVSTEAVGSMTETLNLSLGGGDQIYLEKMVQAEMQGYLAGTIQLLGRRDDKGLLCTLTPAQQ